MRQSSSAVKFSSAFCLDQYLLRVRYLLKNGAALDKKARSSLKGEHNLVGSIHRQ